MISTTKPKYIPTSLEDNKLVQRLQSCVYPCRVPLHGPVQFAIIKVGLLGLSDKCFPQNCLFLTEDCHPHVTHCSLVKPTHNQKRHLDRFGRFIWVPNAMLYKALSMGNKTTKIATSPGISLYLTIAGPSHNHRPRAQKFGKDRACRSGDILADNRQTDRHIDTDTQTYLSQYFVTILPNRSCRQAENDFTVYYCCR